MLTSETYASAVEAITSTTLKELKRQNSLGVFTQAPLVKETYDMHGHYTSTVLCNVKALTITVIRCSKQVTLNGQETLRGLLNKRGTERYYQDVLAAIYAAHKNKEIINDYFYGGGIDYDNPAREPYKRLYYIEEFAAEFAKQYLEILGVSCEEIGGNHLTREEQATMKHLIKNIGRITLNKRNNT